MAGTRQTNTFGEMLQKMLVDLAEMKLAPDADMQFIIDLETQVLGKLRNPIEQATQGGLSQVPGDPMLGMAIGAQGQAPPMGMPPMPQSPEGVNGVRSMPQMPPVDELRRMLNPA